MLINNKFFFIVFIQISMKLTFSAYLVQGKNEKFKWWPESNCTLNMMHHFPTHINMYRWAMLINSQHSRRLWNQGKIQQCRKKILVHKQLTIHTQINVCILHMCCYQLNKLWLILNLHNNEEKIEKIFSCCL